LKILDNGKIVRYIMIYLLNEKKMRNTEGFLMKKWMKLGLAFASVALLTGCTSANSGSQAKNEKQATNSDTVKVGLNYELSGAVSAYAQQQKDALEMAKDEINEAGGILGKKVEVVIKDNKSETA